MSALQSWISKYFVLKKKGPCWVMNLLHNIWIMNLLHIHIYVYTYIYIYYLSNFCYTFEHHSILILDPCPFPLLLNGRLGIMPKNKFLALPFQASNLYTFPSNFWYDFENPSLKKIIITCFFSKKKTNNRGELWAC